MPFGYRAWRLESRRLRRRSQRKERLCSWCTIVVSAILDGLSMHLWCRRVTALLCLTPLMSGASSVGPGGYPGRVTVDRAVRL